MHAPPPHLICFRQRGLRLLQGVQLAKHTVEIRRDGADVWALVGQYEKQSATRLAPSSRSAMPPHRAGPAVAAAGRQGQQANRAADRRVTRGALTHLGQLGRIRLFGLRLADHRVLPGLPQGTQRVGHGRRTARDKDGGDTHQRNSGGGQHGDGGRVMGGSD